MHSASFSNPPMTNHWPGIEIPSRPPERPPTQRRDRPGHTLWLYVRSSTHWQFYRQLKHSATEDTIDFRPIEPLNIRPEADSSSVHWLKQKPIPEWHQFQWIHNATAVRPPPEGLLFLSPGSISRLRWLLLSQSAQRRSSLYSDSNIDWRPCIYYYRWPPPPDKLTQSALPRRSK